MRDLGQRLVPPELWFVALIFFGYNPMALRQKFCILAV